MEQQTLYKLLVVKDKLLVDKYIMAMVTMLKKIYGNRLKKLYDLMESNVTVHQKQLVFLMTLNRESALKDHFMHLEGVEKTKRFFGSLHYLTEDFLNFKLNTTEYVNRCIGSWVVS